MKGFFSLTCAFILVSLLSCSKNSPATPDNPIDPLPATAALTGKWLIQDDSVYNDGNYFITFGGTNNYPVPGMYVGKPEDYYDFQTGGNLSVYANMHSYGVNYTIANNKLIITEQGVSDTSIIVSLTKSAARIERNDTSSNGGVFFHRLNLKK